MPRIRLATIALFGLIAFVLAGCSSKPLIEIGDPTGAPADTSPPARIMMNASGYMDGEIAKVKAELTNKRGEEDGALRIFVLGAADEIEMLVDARWRSQVDQLQPGDDFIAYATLGTAGQEPFERVVLRVR